jgi:hypothetical protein
MDLNLTVPSLSGRVLAEIETKPAKVEQWLSELPLLNIAETSRRVLSHLNIYNRIALEAPLRLQLLELHRYAVNQLGNELAKQYIGLPLPLPDKNKTVAEQHRQFQIEMAFGYKWVVIDALKVQAGPVAPGAPALAKDKLALAIQRAIHYLGETLVLSYESYAPLPLGTWRELHALYRHAERLGLQDIEQPDLCNAALQKSSPAMAYKQALLLDLADPYHLSARQVDKITRYLDRWAGLATILPAPGAFDPTCQFLIDLNNDRAGIAYTADTELGQTEPYRLLNTVELARKVHEQLIQLRHGETPELDGLDAGVFRDGYETLRRLINAWGLHPKRAFRRSARPGAELRVAIGIDGINYWLNGGSKFVVSSTFVGPLPQRTQIGAEDHRRQVRITAEHLDYTSWNVLDESAGGFSLAKKGQIRTRVRVGDIVATRAAGDTGWSIAAIRWARSASPSSIEIGLQRIAPNGEAVVIKTVSESGAESDFLPALRLPEVPAVKEPATLITHCGVYRPDREIYMDNGYRLYKLRLRSLLESTSAYERFEYEILSS